MKVAIEDAKSNGHRFGAILVKDNKILSKSGARLKGDFRYHAEAQVIMNSGKNLKGCVLYSTCEPCPMCFYLAWVTGVSKIVYGAAIQDSINQGISEMQISAKELNEKSGSKIILKEGILKKECINLLRNNS